MSAPKLHSTAVRLFKEWIDQKPGLDPYNYGSRANLNSEYRRITKQGDRALAALVQFATGEYDAETLAEVARTAFSGRLSFSEHGDEIRYTTGQYWPCEYRLAAAVVLEAYNDLMARRAVPQPAGKGD